ncbi:DUF6417 family protein [Streptomyces sp. 21So2-11]|uniref:DUF6417 family protein n=1 Tax=Streptomyces sp. 21So2-11 TaxID=3144408 RepID=UPI00321AFBCE
MADTATRAELATGNHLVWAARLAPDGHDLLLYRPADQDRSRAWLTKQASEGYQEVALQPSEMTMLRRFVALAPRLSHSPAEGLDDAVLEAHWDAECNRWRLQVNRDQMDSIARTFYLERFTGMTTASNRFARKYGVMHRRPRAAR